MNKFYIAIDFFGWAQGETLEKARESRHEDSGMDMDTSIWQVEGDPDMLYSISWFVPQIIGAKCVYRKTKDSHTEKWNEHYGDFGTVDYNEKGRMQAL